MLQMPKPQSALADAGCSDLFGVCEGKELRCAERLQFETEVPKVAEWIIGVLRQRPLAESVA